MRVSLFLNNTIKTFNCEALHLTKKLTMFGRWSGPTRSDGLVDKPAPYNIQSFPDLFFLLHINLRIEYDFNSNHIISTATNKKFRLIKQWMIAALPFSAERNKQIPS